MLFLPRQARDKHRENSKKGPFCCMQEKFSPLLLASLCVSLIHAGLSIYHFEVCENGLF